MYRWITPLAILVLSAGCRMSMDQIKAMQPERPPELDRLDMLVGQWRTEGRVKMMVNDTPLVTTGENEAAWALDNRFLIETARLDMGELGTVEGMSIWWWDPTIRKYRMEWFDSMGETSHATVRYDKRTGIWHMRASGQKYGHATRGRGTLKHIDEDTLEWTWKEYGPLGLIKLADMKGVSRRRK